MFVSMLMSKIIGKTAEEHPVILSENCINNVQKHFSCSICADMCKEDVFADNEPSFDKCTNCNLCSVNCPTQAILPSSFFMKQIISNIEAQKEKVYVYCHKRDGHGDIKVYCLASLAWEIYTVLALNKNVVISLLPCEQCEHATDVVSVLNKIKETMGEDFFQERFSLSDEASVEKIMSRRDLFCSLRKVGQKAAEYIISDTNVSGAGGLIYRKYLLKKLNSLGDVQIGCSWKTPIFNNNCWGCGLCTSFCPNKAMTFVEPDSSGPCLVHIPWHCTQCGQCEQCCPENGIDGWKLIERNLLVQQKVIVDIKVKYCPKCHKPMKPADNSFLCYYCGNKEKYQKDSALE